MDTTKYQKALEEEKELLERELKGVAVQDPHAEGGFAAREDDFSSEPASLDPVEIGTELESLTRNESITNELEDRYNNVVAALKRIEEGTYGICIKSGEPIEAERLDANPAALTCIAHMED